MKKGDPVFFRWPEKLGGGICTGYTFKKQIGSKIILYVERTRRTLAVPESWLIKETQNDKLTSPKFGIIGEGPQL